jgi:hypothetical protein
MNNIGTIDRLVRVAVGLALLVAGWGGFVEGTPGLVLRIAGFIPLATAAVGSCPLYLPLGLDTRSKTK